MNQAILLLSLVLFVTNAGYSDNIKTLFKNISDFINTHWTYMLIIGAICIVAGIITQIPIWGFGGWLVGVVILNWLVLNPLIH